MGDKDRLATLRALKINPAQFCYIFGDDRQGGAGIGQQLKIPAIDLGRNDEHAAVLSAPFDSGVSPLWQG